MDKSGIKVAEYMTKLPKHELLEQKLHKAVDIGTETAGGETCVVQNGDIISFPFNVLCTIQNTNYINWIKPDIKGINLEL